MNPKIYLSFRFHGNFYHSYRGDTPDENGFGKDMRVIRHLLNVLDDFTQRGLPVRGTWDFENYFSLEEIMPRYCPELLEGLQRRAKLGDEFHLMSYNNGLISAHTAKEFEAAVRRGVSNPAGSGLRDLFGEAFYPMVRPQEMLYTPVHLKLYRACGIEAISLYYSAIPFNTFSNFVPPLSLAERYNPLTLTYPGVAETMTLLPCYNTGDLIDHLSLRRWLGQLRRAQLGLDQPSDLLVLIDMDADDESWVGYGPAWLQRRFSNLGGLRGVVESVGGLEYLVFTTPGRYLAEHPPLGEVCIGQDTADGSFDGLSSWAEKHSNHRLWTGLERARLLELQARRLAGAHLPAGVQAALQQAFEARLRLLSTTHFGMSAPVMNLQREAIAANLAQEAVRCAAAAFAQIAEAPAACTFSLLDYPHGEAGLAIEYPLRPSRALVRLPLRASAPPSFTLIDRQGQRIPSTVLEIGGRRELLFVERFEPGERMDYGIREAQPITMKTLPPLEASARGLQNEYLRIAMDGDGQISGLRCESLEFSLGRFLRSGLTYGGRRYEVGRWSVSEILAVGVVTLQRASASLLLPGGYPATYERELMLAAGLPYLYVTMRVAYPKTPDHGFNRGKARRLGRAWDNRWQEVFPCEVRPNLTGLPGSPLRVWKHNYCDHVSSYSLDYASFSPNRELDSSNNAVTHAWLAVSDGRRGLLAAYTADLACGMAFCPLRTRLGGEGMQVRFNPFGAYWGRQYQYPTADTGLGKLLAVNLSAADHLKPYAPSYNGVVQEFRLFLAPYQGDAPPPALRADAEAFAYPYLVLNDGELIADPPHRDWEGI